MLNLRSGALVALLVLAACRGREAYPPDVVDRFLASCIAKLPAGLEQQRDQFAASCRCMLDRIQEKYTVEEFYALEKRMADGSGNVQEELGPIVTDCRK